MISSNEMINLILKFRLEALNMYPEDIDMVDENIRINRLGHFRKNEVIDKLLEELSNSTIDFIVRLVKTPRLIKTILRKTIQTWKTLHGEIDFDDVLVANVIRFAAPEAYDFLIENYREIRGLESEGILKDREERKEKLQIKWDRIIKNVSWDVIATEELITFLFPTWKYITPINMNAIPQGVRQSSPTDYWIRLNIEEIDNDEIKDQDIIRGILNYIGDPENAKIGGKLISEGLLEYPKLPPKFEHFGKILFTDGDVVRSIASSLFCHILKKFKNKSNSDICEGFYTLWRLAIRKPIDKEKHIEWVINEIEKALPESLRFANDIYYYWRSNSESDVQEKHHIELRNLFVKKAKSIYQKNEELLIKCIDPSFIYCVSHFVNLYSSEGEGGPGFKITEWEWFFSLLIDAARKSPNIIVPQIIGMLVKSQRIRVDYIHEFNIDLATQIFNKKLPEIMSLITKIDDYKQLNKNDQKLIEQVMNWAKNWMQKQNIQN